MQSNKVDYSKVAGGVIETVFPNGIAEQLDFQSGDIISKINGVELLDILDYRYQIADDEVIVEIYRDGKAYEFEIEKDYDDDLGIEFDDVLFDRIRRCHNNCDFCFIYQLPKKMRRSLYIKDDDYRLSFLYGNYVTLAGLTDFDYKKIIEYHLSPLYVSVHATDLEQRRKLLKNPNAEDIIDRIQFLIDAGIEIHTQAVIVPQLNDGKILDQTMADISKLYPGVKHFGVVPVGLTQYQSRLKRMKPHNVEEARECVKQIEDFQVEFLKTHDSPFVQVADEFYLKAHTPVPPQEHYGAYELLENGIGSIRLFVNEFIQNYDQSLTPFEGLTGIITSEDGAIVFRDYIWPLLSEKHTKSLKVIKINNNHFGESVTVSGLMVGKDIIEQVKPKSCDRYLIPKNCLKFDSPIFLDDLTVNDLNQHLNTIIQVTDTTASSFLEGVFEDY
ncbi:MAG: radical SAM protein [Candidatus Cloacimonadota bacterium]|nr:MAG: radical SAM protein [Candidatus Cloacimonadota bacterium]